MRKICDHLLLIYHKGKIIAYLLLYVDDIILTTFDTTLLKQIINTLSIKFAMTGLEAL